MSGGGWLSFRSGRSRLQHTQATRNGDLYGDQPAAKGVRD